MAIYKVKSVIISKSGRGKGDRLTRPCMVSLFDVTNPHKSGKSPQKVLIFDNISEVIISGAHIRFLLAGNDILIEGMKSLHIAKKGKKLTVSAK